MVLDNSRMNSELIAEGYLDDEINIKKSAKFDQKKKQSTDG
jgi:hypothetical protein